MMDFVSINMIFLMKRAKSLKIQFTKMDTNRNKKSE